MKRLTGLIAAFFALTCLFSLPGCSLFGESREPEEILPPAEEEHEPMANSSAGRILVTLNLPWEQTALLRDGDFWTDVSFTGGKISVRAKEPIGGLYLIWGSYPGEWTLETESGKEGYVVGANRIAKRLGGKGWGIWTQDVKIPDGQNGYEMKPGDIMSTNGHVWISLGTCADGSVVIVHSSPSKSRTGQPGAGVQISAVGTSESCQAYVLADRYMSKYYPAWYERYPIYLCNPDAYFGFTGENAGRFSWDTSGAGVLTDPDGLQNRKPDEVLAFLFQEQTAE